MTTKILALTDALGNLVRFVLLPGQRFDTVGVAPLIDGLAYRFRSASCRYCCKSRHGATVEFKFETIESGRARF